MAMFIYIIVWRRFYLADTQQPIPKVLENFVEAKLKREIILSVSFMVCVYVCECEKTMKRTVSIYVMLKQIPVAIGISLREEEPLFSFL